MNAENSVNELLRLASGGDDEALGQLLQRYRPMLETMARERLCDAIKPRLGESDVVQQSCLSAIRDFDQFSGGDPGQFVAWLKQIHQRNLQDAARDHLARGKRDVTREVQLDPISPARAPVPTASQCVAQREASDDLTRAIETLPEAQRVAVRMRHLEGKSLQEIAEHLDRSTAATAGLIKRGLASLRGVLRT